MHNWKKHRNFRKYEKPDGSYLYTVTVEGTVVEVGKEIYEAYAQGGYKMENMEYGLKANRVLMGSDGRAIRDGNGQAITLPEREVSLDKLMSEGWDYPSAEPSPEDAVLFPDFSGCGALAAALVLLTEAEYSLLESLFYRGMTEKDYAASVGTTQQNINKLKKRILKKIKIFLDGGC